MKTICCLWPFVHDGLGRTGFPFPSRSNSRVPVLAPAAATAAPYASQKVTKISEKFPMLCKTDSSEKGVLLLLLLSLLPAEYSSTDGIIITQQQLLLSAIRYCQTYLQGHPPHMTVTTHVSMFELEGVELGSLGLKSLISRESTSRSSRVPYVKMGTNPANSAGDPQFKIGAIFGFVSCMYAHIKTLIQQQTRINDNSTDSSFTV